MALPHIDDEQLRTWTREQKDRFWLEKVFRGDMPQLTARAAITGFLLGGVLSATNLYIGAKTGWSLGVGVTSVILAYAMFRVFGRLGIARDFTILENNAVQSVATAAGYMTAPLISSLTAFMVMNNRLLPRFQIFCWCVVTSILGVLVAFPMKRRFVNDEQQPFPEGRACAVVLDSLYPDAPQGGERAPEAPYREAADPYARWLGELKARALFGAAGVAAFIEFLKLESYQVLLQHRLFGLAEARVWHLPEKLFGWYYDLAARHHWWIPKILGTDLRQLAISPTLDLTMIGAGGLSGKRTANSLLVGAVLNYGILAPWMIRLGEIQPRAGGGYGRAQLLNTWCLWWGVAIMVTGSLAGLFAKPEVLLSAFRGLTGKKRTEADPVAHIELPLKVSYVGVPVVAAVAVFLNWYWFGINPWFGLLAVPMIIVLTMIAANATGLTSTTPTGSLSKITQFTFGALDRSNPATNLITAGMTAEVASNASNLLMDIKPGYMLGAKPRQQAWGHVLGIISGGIAATVLFFPLFLPHYNQALPLGPQLMTEKFPLPGVEIWRGVAQLIASGGASLKTSALVAMLIAAVAGAVMEVLRVKSRGRFPLSPVAIGLGVVIPVDSTLMMWLGAWLFDTLHKRYAEAPKESLGRGLWVESSEPIAAGIVAGAALTGIGDQLISVFILGR
ncbi:MAG: OPT/YSL family transporter [Deltaproteobacteria bacterium]|nr:OPT/YSL family transporter [Deltaproteobacteria bacterium]